MKIMNLSTTVRMIAVLVCTTGLLAAVDAAEESNKHSLVVQ
ncbi:MAG TPA: hypothetical protein QF499_05935 [Gammaproteobacteria bacterium]|jgi:hypothetical protein|nr:hypothetical protein [Gammaproteobacteria bacterium]